MTPLMYAAKGGHHELVQELLAHGESLAALQVQRRLLGWGGGGVDGQKIGRLTRAMRGPRASDG